MFNFQRKKIAQSTTAASGNKTFSVRKVEWPTPPLSPQKYVFSDHSTITAAPLFNDVSTGIDLPEG